MSIYDDVKKMHIGFPRNYIALSRGFTSSHQGIDMCWNNNYGGPNAPVYAPADGEVVALVDGKGNTWGTSDHGWGNYIKIKHATNVYTLSAHLLRGSFRVKIGDKVKRGQMVAQMNNSGYSNGCHVHFELYIGGSGTGYRVDPQKYCYAYPTDTINKNQTGIMRYSPITFWGTPVERNTAVDQCKIITNTLRARKEPGLKGEILGYVKTGIFNTTGEVVKADGYTWYHIEDFWCAQDAEGKWLEFYPAKIQKFNLLMKNLDPNQKSAMEAWCKDSNVEFEVTEV